MGTVLDLFGCLTKVENLWCLGEYGVKNSCILESLDAFPGYYGNAPASAQPLYVYIVAGEPYLMEDIIRIAKKVKFDHKKPFDAAFTQISMRHATCCAVRIAGVSDYESVKPLQECFQKHGLTLKKKVSDIENSPAVIKIYKFFLLESVAELIYRDLNNPDIGYFTISEDIEWEEFSKNIQILRNNISDNTFDAAKSYVYMGNEIQDMVRIYSKNLTNEFLVQLKEKYNLLFPYKTSF